ncbi:methyltransferase domain-containing protein [Mobilicoccus caccae]|uniref:Methyltransferase domain-containing protein n=1 Tax=Mobilicoccus caccae TaxID=1859295 RepID=A0ABQ6IKF8_9MICO|nr:methyltransferase domain-containing protein [Mobilicoccus caccae]GMA38231.1 hypothetical protein GCM10025883_02760 [Mobilicoccus caccae]
MFVFGVCVESTDRFDRHCLPAIAAYGGDDATLMSSPDLPVARTYNDVLEASLDLDGVEAVVLLRDDVEIVDPHFRTRILAAFERDPQLAIIGASGAGSEPRWWQTAARSHPGSPPGAADNAGTPVDYVDSACIVLRPDLAARLRFDDVAFTGPSGFEVDFCHRAREQGWRISVEPISLTRHADPDDIDAAYQQAAAVWQGRRARSVTLGTLEHHVALEEGTHERPERFGTLPAPAPPESGFTARHRRILQAVPPTAGRVLQLGCGTGVFAHRLAVERGAVVTGIDHEGGHLDQARRTLHHVVAADLNRLPDLDQERGHFDAIVAVDILDRLVDPEASLAALLPYLAPDGVVVAAIPNVKHWSVVLPLLLHDRFEYRDAGLLHRGSIHLFTMVEAVAMFRRLGLSRIEACGVEEIPLHDPSHLDALVGCIASYGTDSDEARTMLEAYEYVLRARRA